MVRDQPSRPVNETNPLVRPLAAMDWEGGKLSVIRDYRAGYPEENEIPAKALIERPIRYLLPNSDVVIEGIHLNTPRNRSNAQIYWLEELEELGCALDRHGIQVWLFPHRLSYKYADHALPNERMKKKQRGGEVKLVRNKQYDYRFLLRYCKEYGLPTKRWKPPDEAERALRAGRDRLRAEISDMANLLRTSGARGVHPDAVEIYNAFTYHTAIIGPRMSDATRDYFALKAPTKASKNRNEGWVHASKRESMLKIAYACVFDKTGEPRYEGKFSTRYVTAMAGLSDQGCASHMRSTILGGDTKGSGTDKDALKRFTEALRLFADTRSIQPSRE